MNDRRRVGAGLDPPSSGWIPVTDEEEPQEGWVLICIQPRIGPRDVNIGTWDGYRKQWRSRLGWKVEGEVTHWMPLPAPPE